MNCNQAIEHLPWLLNGTLGEDETKAVEEHLAGCASCRQALTDTRRAWELFDQHIPSAPLVAYAADEDLDGFDQALLEEHLATCPECAAELELVRMSRSLAEDHRVAILAPRPPRAPVAPAAPTTARPVSTAGNRWRRAAVAAGIAGIIAVGGWYKSAERAHTLASQLATAPPPSAPLQAPPAPPAQSAASTADAERIATLQHQVDEMTKTLGEMQAAQSHAREQLAQVEKQSSGGPQVNPWVGDVRMSADVVRGGGGSVKEVPAGTAATLLLAADTAAAGDREAEISDAGGKIVWKGSGLRATPQGDYSLLLPKGWLPAGDYTIHLYRQAGGQRQAAESYAIRVK